MRTKDEQARKLAAIHYRVEDGVTRIFWIVKGGGAESRPGEPIKLLETNVNTIPSGVVPLRFGSHPSEGIHHPSVIVEVTPEEFRKIRAGALALPDGWEVGELIPKPMGDGNG
jgi:hypothetical protein